MFKLREKKSRKSITVNRAMLICLIKFLIVAIQLTLLVIQITKDIDVLVIPIVCLMVLNLLLKA